MALRSAPATVLQNPKADPACQFTHRLIVQETGGFLMQITALRQGTTDLSASLQQLFGTAHLAPFGTLQGDICLNSATTLGAKTYTITGITRTRQHRDRHAQRDSGGSVRRARRHDGGPANRHARRRGCLPQRRHRCRPQLYRRCAEVDRVRTARRELAHGESGFRHGLRIVQGHGKRCRPLSRRLYGSRHVCKPATPFRKPSTFRSRLSWAPRTPPSSRPSPTERPTLRRSRPAC